MTQPTPLPEQSALVLRDALASGALSATELAQACIDRITAREDTVQAWVWFDPAHALAEAARLDALRASGAVLGPLHGLPVGVKDVIDTADMPTRNGCPVDLDRQPSADAVLVARLRAAGAIIFGKTVTTELAFLYPNKTRNPVNPRHTPGGSSSGSAAAVADGMIPLAIGTQTGGSVVRPASFCGVTGFKPTFAAIPSGGVLVQSPSLDTLGVFARDTEGAALLAGVLMDGGEGVLPAAATPVTQAPRLILIHPPAWDQADPALHAGFDRLCTALGAVVTPGALPALFDDAADQRAVINTADMGHYFARYIAADPGALGPPTRAAIIEGKNIPSNTYLAAMDHRAAMPAALAPLFANCDALLCPAALGPAPEGLTSTGDSIFNGLWTTAGTPTITLPLLTAPNGLPMGVQLVGAPGADAALMQTARWLQDWARDHFT